MKLSMHNLNPAFLPLTLRHLPVDRYTSSALPQVNICYPRVNLLDQRVKN